MANLKVVAKVVVKKEKTEFVKDELLKLIDITRAEEGCIQYELHQGNEDSSVFFFCETWESKELLEKHLANDHIAAYMKNTEGCIDEFVINELTLLM